MLTRVRRLEQARTSSLSPFESMPGGLAWFEDYCRAGIEAGDFDSRDVPMVVSAVRRWHDSGCFTR